VGAVFQPIDNQYYAATKREQTRLNTSLFVNIFRVFRVALPAHNGLVEVRVLPGPAQTLRLFVRTLFSISF
jgi:hypothetical protein